MPTPRPARRSPLPNPFSSRLFVYEFEQLRRLTVLGVSESPDVFPLPARSRLDCRVAAGLGTAAPITLDQALERAVQRSEATRASRAGVTSASEAARAAGQLPDPMLGDSLENLPVTGRLHWRWLWRFYVWLRLHFLPPAALRNGPALRPRSHLRCRHSFDHPDGDCGQRGDADHPGREGCWPQAAALLGRLVSVPPSCWHRGLPAEPLLIQRKGPCLGARSALTKSPRLQSCFACVCALPE